MAGMMPDMESYFSQFIPKEEGVAARLVAEAETEGVPIVGPVMGRLLAILTAAVGARRILELGTATGYSAILMAGAAVAASGADGVVAAGGADGAVAAGGADGAVAAGGADGSVDTLEQDPEMARRARENIAEAGLAHRIAVHRGDALKIMADLTGPYDLAFLDIEKSAYVGCIDPCARLLRPGGLLVADNTGFADADAFNRAIWSDPRWRACHLLAFLPAHSPERDGVCLALRTSVSL